MITIPGQNIKMDAAAGIDPVWYEKLKSIEALINLLTSGLDGSLLGAWKAYTPSFGASSGSITSATASGRYRLVGKTCNFSASLSITTNGTAAGSISIGLPVAASAVSIANGRETNVTGKM